MTQRTSDDLVIPRLAVTPKPAPLAPPKEVDETLIKILTWKRPHDSVAEKTFCEWLSTTLNAMAVVAASTHKDKLVGFTHKIGPVGNIILTLKGKDGAGATTLFSCHVDTVHYDGGKQDIVYDPSFGHIFLDRTDPKKMGSCLGADDGAGVWLLLQMVKAGVPGTYVFHRGEEKGCLGSRAMVEQQREWLAQFELAVAFDRAGTSEVITHQGSVRCASDKAGNWIAGKLTSLGLMYETSDRGVLTDTKQYRHLIPECFNIGVGYENQHSTSETLDYDHLTQLANACVAIDWDFVPIERDPKAPEPYAPQYGGWGGYGGWRNAHGGTPTQGSFPGFDDHHELDGVVPPRVPSNPPKPAGKAPAPSVVPTKEPALSTADELMLLDIDELRTWVEEADTDTVVYSVIDVLSEIEALKARLAAYQSFLGLAH